jgi:hypothetical protein
VIEWFSSNISEMHGHYSNIWTFSELSHETHQCFHFSVKTRDINEHEFFSYNISGLGIKLVLVLIRIITLILLILIVVSILVRILEEANADLSRNDTLAVLDLESIDIKSDTREVIQFKGVFALSCQSNCLH